MALTFPANPTNGQIYDQYVYDATAQTWRVYGSDTGITNVLATKANLSGGNTFTGNQIFNSGIVSNPNKPAFAARSSGGSVASTQTYPYSVATVNIGSCYNTSTYRFTAPIAGTYIFSIYHIGSNTATVRFKLFKNSTDLLSTGEAHQARANFTSDYTSMTSFWVVSASANDYFYVQIYAGTDYGSSEYAWFSGFLVG